MAYKKYIQRNGKLYGPYIYQSKRVDGKVVSEYYGSEGIKKDEVIKRSDGIKRRDYNYKKIFLISLGIVLLGVLVYFIAFNNQNSKLTGGAILGVDTSYQKGESLDGVLRFSVKEGELIPESSKIVFENAGKTYEFPLNEILKETPSEGNYYIDGKNISGSGLGYGLEGQKTVYPDIGFTLQVYTEAAPQSDTINESTPAEVTTEVSNEITPETTPAEPIVEDNSSAPITGGVVKNSGGFFSSLFGLTGNVVSMALQNEVSEVTAKDNPFVYDLQGGETAELKPASVSLNGERLGDNIVSVQIENNKATVTTEYSETEKGYGKDYVGEKEKTLSLDLTALNLSLEEGDLNIKLVYQNEDILQLTTLLKEGETASGEIVEEPVSPNVSEENQTPVETSIEANITNQTVEEIVNSSIWDIGDFLTPQERKVLSDEFGNISLKKVKSETLNDKIIMGYGFGGYYVEYSYDSSLNKDILNVQMEKDRIKFLKDIANSVEKKNSETSPQVLEGYNETYTP